MKTRGDQQTILHDHPEQWAAMDLEVTQRTANHLHRPRGHHGPIAAEFWQQRQPISPQDRTAFSRPVRRRQDQDRDELSYPKDQTLSPKAQARLDRLAIRCACVDSG
jgi:hypothetical protein